MVKVILLLNRREGMSVDEFRRYAREQHAPFCYSYLDSPGWSSTTPSLTIPAPPPPYDAIAEDWFESAEAMGAAFQSPAGQAVQADAPKFLDMSKFQMVVVQEDEITASVAQTAQR
ncbi:MAG: EthD domain-containing protein [Chloroflexi bacterium]|nr:EthD domain-containing protein [Chloroflexota bacterium]